MREIKFRGKRVDNGQWVHGDLWRSYSKNESAVCVIRDGHGNMQDHEVIPETIGQYIDLKDKNKVDIYEGDILSVTDPYGENEKKFAVEFHDGVVDIEWHSMFDGGDADMTALFYAMIADFTFEVVGNIHENPELIQCQQSTPA